ncbi:HPr family phosphocarrier protein [Gordonia jinghuaiqii]|uniref:Phosphocarrier protein HPr n=1 Tax=Gordonia jinghuaiqii TaxID=2758710 RepID=A0A7D7R2J9_9ACTN|nr:HPr family phosphocarrier protein [Gordonia jinghuaiqii]MCR5976267.1 HPr family phosphocarrier protein [Gordonia jinghuaiqii]QMT03491.1 HPr family phosphocarrier protein [Gordonia jinghuaiqii]
MPSTIATVGSAVGLHARPATIIAEAVAEAGNPVTIGLEGGDPVDAGSALMIMTLGAEKGTKVVVTAEDQDTLDAIVTLVETDLDAD